MNTRSFLAALAAACSLPLTAWGQYGVASPVYNVPPSGPMIPPAAPAMPFAGPVRPAPVPSAYPYASVYLPPEHAWFRDTFSIDLRGFYGFRAAPHSRYATDMVGLEGELAWYFSPRQAFTLSASFGSGGNDTVNYIDTAGGFMPVSEDFTRDDISFMAGYRFTQPLTRRTTISFGLKAGLDVQNLSYDDYWGHRHGHHHWGDDCCDNSYSETSCGFAYAASVTLETRISEHALLMLGYQYRGATTKPDAPSVVPGGPAVPANTLRWHEVHLGVRFVF